MKSRWYALPIMLLVLCLPAAVHALVPPTNVTATALSSSSIRLNWTDTNSNEAGYAIERSLLPLTGFGEIFRTAANAVTYTDTLLASSTTYYYRIRVFKHGNQYSTYSSIVSATTFSSSGPPTVSEKATGCTSSYSEPDIVTNPTDPQNVAFSMNSGCGTAYTLNALGTQSWVQSNPAPFGSDMQMAVTSTGKMYAADVQTRVWSSTNKGQTFSGVLSTAMIPGQTLFKNPDGTFAKLCPTPRIDYPKLQAFGQTVYLTAAALIDRTQDGTCDNLPGQVFIRSLDGGLTWGDGQVMADMKTSATDAMSVSADNILTWPYTKADNTCDIAVITSADSGHTWSSPVCAVHNPNGTGNPLIGTIEKQFWVAVDPANSMHLALAFHGASNWFFDFSCKPNACREEHVWVTRSDSGGALWRTPVRVDQGVVGTQVERGGRLAVSIGGSGRVDVIWEDHRLAVAPASGIEGDFYYNYSHDGGTTYGAEIRLSTITQVVMRSTMNVAHPGDYIGLASLGNNAFAAYDSGPAVSGSTCMVFVNTIKFP